MNPIKFLLALVWGVLALGPTHLQGIQGVESGNQDRRPKTWRDTIQYLDPQRTMFTQMLMRLKTKKVSDPEFKLFEREHRSQWTRCNEAMDNSETAWTVDDGSMWKADDIGLCDDEYIKVTSVSGNVLTVVRGALGSTAAAHDDNTWILRLFERQKENDTSGTGITTDFSTITNYTQILEIVYGISATNKATKKRGTSDLSLLRAEALADYKRQMEHMIIWGKKRLEMSGGDVYRYSGGLDEFITSNRLDAEGGLGFGDIGWIVNQTTRYGGSKKFWFCGRDARQELDSLGLEYMRIKSSENMLGMAIDGVRTSFGEFALITHHGLENAHANRIYIVDPLHISLAVLRPMKHNKNIQENDRDGEKHQFIGEAGLWLDTEESHAVVTNVGGVI